MLAVIVSFVIAFFLLFLSYSKKKIHNPIALKQNDIAIAVKKQFLDIAKEDLCGLIAIYAPNADVQSRELIRSEIIRCFSSGIRAATLTKILQGMLKEEQGNARKLAEHSLGFISARYHQSRYKDSGIERYKWSTAGDERVSENHKKLNGKVFIWSAPPISGKNGERLHPGEGFGCRCIAIPVLED